MKGRQDRARLNEIAELNPRLVEAVPFDTPVSFVPMSALTADTASVAIEERRYGDVCKGYTPFLDGDLLIAKITPCFENGKIAQAKLEHRFGFGSTEFHVVRPRPDLVDARYLLHFLRQGRIRHEGERRMTGSAGQRRVPEHFLSHLEVPLLRLPEQRRIAAILDQAEALRAKRRHALAQLDHLMISIFLDRFGDPVSNPKGWPRRRIGNIGQVITGNTPSRRRPDYYGAGIEWIKSDNINTPYHFLTDADETLTLAGKIVARTVPEGSILVTCIAGSPSCIGNCAITNREVAFNQQINALVPKEGNVYFLYTQILVGKKLIREASTDSMKGMVSKSRFEDIQIMFPPLPAQNSFSDVFLAVNKLKTSYHSSLEQMDRLFSSLQDRAFR